MIVVVGGGPAGLTLATEVGKSSQFRSLVLERSQYFGGTPLSTDHWGFGMRDLHRLMTGPQYVRELVDRAQAAGVELRRGMTVTKCGPNLEIEISGGGEKTTMQAIALVLATGVRERSRPARCVAGARGSGVYTTGSLQRLVHQMGARVGNRAVVIGAEHVSFSAISTLAKAGCETVALITRYQKDQSFAPLRWMTAGRRRVPIIVNDALRNIDGHQRVTSVTLDSGRKIDCDTVVFTGDWIPENDLVKILGIDLVANSLGPGVDSFGRTNVSGVFAIGNLVHPAEPADVCAVHSKLCARAMTQWLQTGKWPRDLLAVRPRQPLLWTWPSQVGQDDRDQKMLLRSDVFCDSPNSIEIFQAGNLVWSKKRSRGIVPNRSFGIGMQWVQELDPNGGDVEISFRS